MWVLRWWSRVKRLSHSGHANGFSPVWVRSWFCKTCLYPNDRLQVRQVNDLSRVGSLFGVAWIEDDDGDWCSMDPIDCGEEPEVGGLIGPGLIAGGDVSKFVYGWNIWLRFLLVAFRGPDFFDAFEVSDSLSPNNLLSSKFLASSDVVVTILLLPLIFLPFLTLCAGEMGEIGGEWPIGGICHGNNECG